MIPKTIHYCWFGNHKKSKLIKKCIQSWRTFCPEYEIIEWNESNFDINICPYVKEAYEQKKWAYVSDYVRFFVLNQYGGIYLDTDVEMLRPIDKLLKNDSFAGFANSKIVATGLIFACHKDNWLCQEVLESYEGESFVWDNPEKILAIGRRVTELLVKNGLELNGREQTINGTTIYPKAYFNSTNGDYFAKPDKDAYTIHHYEGTWFSKKDKFKKKLRQLVGTNIMNKLSRQTK